MKMAFKALYAGLVMGFDCSAIPFVQRKKPPHFWGMKAKRFNLTDESLNVYGTWILSSGIDWSDFDRNPVCLWNHYQDTKPTKDSVLPIGYWKDRQEDGPSVNAVPELDMQDAFAVKIANKIEHGTIRACSIGVRILEMSDDPALKKPGQLLPTIVNCVVREVSLVDIPGNKSGLILYDQADNRIDTDALTLSDVMRPFIKSTNVKLDMDPQLLVVAALLGLNDKATAPDIQGAIKNLSDSKQLAEAKVIGLEAKLAAFEQEQKTARKQEVVNLLDAAQTENRINATNRLAFEQLFDANYDAAKTALAGLPVQVKLSDVPNAGGAGAASGVTHQGKTFAQLSKDNPNELIALRDSNFTLFKQLYKAEYGKSYNS